MYCSAKCRTKVMNGRRIDKTRKDYPPRACPGCGDSFKPRSVDQTCCGPECYNRARLRREKQERQQRRKCEHCGKWFRTRNSRRHFCSQGCIRHRFYLALLARSDLPPEEKERRILRCAGPARNPTPGEIRLACLAIQSSWPELERQQRIVGGRWQMPTWPERISSFYTP